ncbi:MAG TPA: hypothetical protein VLL52_14140, partial [Anaerolineae bacterium]|nr:hypothetical protein [Anaerolineae bacterium]
MNITLLRTKLFPPKPRPATLPRPHLITALLTNPTRPLTLITAPAGFGKTTLITQWRHTPTIENHPLAWLSLDPYDNQPDQFFTYLHAAWQDLNPDWGQTAQPLLNQSPLPTIPLINTLLNDLATQPHDQRHHLVLDDYHHLTHPLIHEAITHLLEHAPPNLHLIIISRTRPPLPLARLRARQHLLELTSHELRFTPDETARFLRQTITHHLSDDLITTLNQQTEGWIAALQLAALAHQNSSANQLPPPNTSPNLGPHHYLADYLTDEVLRQQDNTTYQFLLRTAILDRFCADLCHTLTNHPHPQQQLETLDQANLFLIPLDNHRQWYRYHNLFADLLRHHLAQQQPDLLPQLHNRASHWYAANNYPDEAIHHALAARDWPRAADLITHTIHDRLWRQSQFHTIRHWLNRLPTDLLPQHPSLLIADIILTWEFGQRERLTTLLDQADQAIAASTDLSPPAKAHLQADVTAARVHYLSHQWQWPLSQKLSQDALNHIPTSNQLAYARICNNLGVTHLKAGDTQAALTAFTSAITHGRASHNLITTLHSHANLTEVHGIRGDFPAAHTISQQGFALAQQHYLDQTAAVAHLHYETGKIHYWQHNLSQAQHHFQAAITLGRHGESADLILAATYYLAHTHHANHDPTLTQTTLDQAHTLQDSLTDSHGQRPSPAYKWYQAQALAAHLALKQDDHDAVPRWAAARGLTLGPTLDAILTTNTPREFELILITYHFLATQHHLAWPLADYLRQANEMRERNGRYTRILTLAALAASQQHTSHPLDHLHQAIILATPVNHQAPFRDLLTSLTPLLTTLARPQTTPFIATLHAATPPPP